MHLGYIGKEKKHFVEELKQQLDRSHAEKNLIIQDLKKQNDQLHKLVDENSRLKHNIPIEINKFDEQRKDLIKDLEEKINQGVTDQVLETVLKQIETINLHSTKLGTIHFEELVSPTTVAQLIKGGYVKSRIPIISQSPEGTITHFSKRILDYTPKLTSDQQQQIENLTNHYARDLDYLKLERKKINEDMESHFNKKFQSGSSTIPKKPDPKELLGMVPTFDLLRLNLDKECRCWGDAVNNLMSTLSILQRANFIVQTEYRYNNLQQLDYLWGAIYGTKNSKK